MNKKSNKNPSYYILDLLPYVYSCRAIPLPDRKDRKNKIDETRCAIILVELLKTKR